MSDKIRKIVRSVGVASMLVALGALGATVAIKRASTKTVVVPEVQPQVFTERAPTGTAVLYGKITDISSDAKDSVITVNLLEWVLGSDNQEQAAIEDGFCTIEKAEQDSCVPNGFYVRNTKKEMTLNVVQDAAIKITARSPEGHYLSDDQGSLYPQAIHMSELKEKMKVWNLEAAPFIITTRDGVVIGLTEQYLP